MSSAAQFVVGAKRFSHCNQQYLFHAGGGRVAVDRIPGSSRVFPQLRLSASKARGGGGRGGSAVQLGFG